MNNELETDFLSLFLNQYPLIDVRSEIEFSKGSFAKSVNLPLLNTEERHLVGTCYKQQGREEAIKLGAQLVQGETKEERVHQWCKFLKQNPQSRIYCFRGGLRSQIVQQWLQDEGFLVKRIQGGHKALRRFLQQTLKVIPQKLHFIILGGLTGCGKTQLLRQLNALYPVCDLEHLANHRGSAFGKRERHQPSQVFFENILAQELIPFLHHSSSFPILLESESRNIGKCQIPDDIFHKMQESPLIILEKTFQQRLDFIIETYVKEKTETYQFNSSNPMLEFSQEIKMNLQILKTRLGGLRLQECLRAVDQTFEEIKIHHEYLTPHALWIEKILLYYYDPTYQRHRQKNKDRIIFTGNEREISEFLHHYYMR